MTGMKIDIASSVPASRRPCAVDNYTQESVLIPNTSSEFALEFSDMACNCCTIAARWAACALVHMKPIHPALSEIVRALVSATCLKPH